MEQVSYLYNERRFVSMFLCLWLEIKFAHVLLFGVNECVVWFLALPASIEAAALVREVSRLQTVFKHRPLDRMVVIILSCGSDLKQGQA